MPPKKPYTTRVTDAAKAFVAARRLRMQTCGGYCEMIPFSNGKCKHCRAEADALRELEELLTNTGKPSPPSGSLYAVPPTMKGQG